MKFIKKLFNIITLMLNAIFLIPILFLIYLITITLSCLESLWKNS